jgi:NDP-sugar pyrophosphorylase family protein
MNGDSFFAIDLSSFWSWHYSHRANATIALVNMKDTTRYGRIHLDADGALVSFEEKNANATPGWINGGIYLIARTLLLTIPESGAVSLEQEVFTAWIGKGLYGYKSQGRFLDIGTPEAYAGAEHFFAEERL